jgi:vesicle-associated membrane protein 7
MQNKSTPLENAQQKVNLLKETMHTNISIALENTIKLDDITEKTNFLVDNSNKFYRTTRKLKNKMWWKRVQLYIIFGSVILIIIGIIIAVIMTNLKSN